jgi:hypothetical protein
MRKFLAILLLALASQSAMAQHHGHGGYRGYGWGWVAPAVIGGAIIYGATRQYEQAPTVIYTQPAPNPTQSAPVIVPRQQYAMPDTPGTVWRQDWRYDQFCNCYRQYLIQVQ